MTLPVLQDEFGDRVFTMRLEGTSERQCAKQFGITVAEVHKHVMARARTIDHAARSLEISLELDRIDLAAERFFGWMMSAETAAEAIAPASIWIRLGERKAAILGTDFAPRRTDTLTLIEPTPRSENSTERMRKIINRIINERPAPVERNGTAPSPSKSDPQP